MDKMRAANGLLTYYIKLYTQKYGKPPTINRYKEKYAFADVFESIGYQRGKEVLDYYFRLSKPGHPTQWFMYNFDRLDEVMRELAEDEVRKKDLMRETAARTKEWEARQNERRVETDFSSMSE